MIGYQCKMFNTKKKLVAGLGKNKEVCLEINKRKLTMTVRKANLIHKPDIGPLLLPVPGQVLGSYYIVMISFLI